MTINKRLTGKRYGFYVMMASALLAIVAAAVYAGEYGKNARFMDWAAFALLLVGAIVAVALAFINWDEIGMAVLALFSLISLLLYVDIIHGYVMVVAVGIDLDSFSSEFLASTVMLALNFVVSFVAIFLPKNKNKIKEEKLNETNN